MKISVIIPVFNSSLTLERCLESILRSDYPDLECFVIDDGSTDNSSEIAGRFPVQVTKTQQGPKGPAQARNMGAEQANGEILLFVDSDVTIQPDTLSKIASVFDHDPDITAIFGSYDDQPDHRDFFSQYKNLFHHFVHQTSQPEASTFWSGCGAIKRDIFLSVGGFDAEKYPKPSIEDIELGYRLKTLGYKISLQKEIQVKHLKKWSFFGLIKTDIFQRAVPWSRLIFKHKKLPNDLNISSNQRISTILLLLLVPLIAFFVFYPNLILLPVMTILAILCASCWQWQEADPYFEISQRKEPLIFGSITVIYVLALWNNQIPLLAPFVLLIPLLIMGKWLSLASPILRRLLYLGMFFGIGAAFMILLASYPTFLWLPLLIILLLIVILNRKLYLFFAQKRGILFTFATLPMQLLYYLYSFFSFIGVGAVHVWNTIFHKPKTTLNKEQLPGTGRPM